MTKFWNAPLAAALVVATAEISQGADNATISGKVTFKGEPPAEKVIKDVGTDTDCKKMHSTLPTTRHYVVNADGGLANVFVHVKAGLEGKNYPPPKEAVVLDQKGCLYHPYVLGVQSGQDLEIVNSDPIMHNVHALPSNPKEQFNFSQFQQGRKDRKKLISPEIMVQFKCDVHGWMFAYVGVVPHPFFDTTRESGTFKLSGLPGGSYTIEAWHHKAGTKTQSITVGAGESKNIDFTFEAKESK